MRRLGHQCDYRKCETRIIHIHVTACSCADHNKLCRKSSEIAYALPHQLRHLYMPLITKSSLANYPYRKFIGNTFFLGLHDRSYEGGYEWSDNSPLTYVNWIPNQPNDVSQSQNCVLMDSRNGQWLDWRCRSLYSFICKKTVGMKILLFHKH